MTLVALPFASASAAAAGGFPGPFNGQLAVQVNAEGHFNIGAFPEQTTGGAGPRSYSLTYVWPSGPGTSDSTIRIDGADQEYGIAGERLLAPTDSDRSTNTSSWRYGDVDVTQTLQIVRVPSIANSDYVAIRYRVVNRGSRAHSVGMRIMQDTDVAANDHAPFRVPGVGPVVNETDFAGDEIPLSFEIFRDLADADHIGAATIDGFGGLRPDRLVIGNWGHLRGTRWDVSVNGAANSDSAYAVYWNPSNLSPGASRTYETRLGLRDVSTQFNGSLGLGVSAPERLTVSAHRYQPNPFPVVATVSNTSNAVLTGAQATITLPPWLTLAGGNATQAIGTLSAGGERAVTWQVRALAGGADHRPVVRVTASAGSASATVTRAVIVPSVNVEATFGGSWPYDGNRLTLNYSYSGAHRYLGNVSQGGTNWTRSDSHVTVQQWPGAPYQLHVPITDVAVNDTWWGMTIFASDCSGCEALPYTRNTIQLNQRTLDAESDFQRTKVATHEMGHAMGLAHPLDNGQSSSLQTIMRQGRLNINTPMPYDTNRMREVYP